MAVVASGYTGCYIDFMIITDKTYYRKLQIMLSILNKQFAKHNQAC